MIEVIPIPCLEDNYAYLLDDGSGGLAVVDASDAPPIERALTGRRGRLTAIFATHHHHDDVGGNEALIGAHRGLRVFGFESDRGRIPGQTEFLADQEVFAWGGAQVRALHIPGHTLGAVAYAVEGLVFTGDTLFLAGCGRLFEGTPAMMHRSLNEVLARLDPRTRIYCGHEYTVSNLLFAASVEPGNGQVSQRLSEAKGRRARGEPTVGTTLQEELDTNPFLRCAKPELRASAGAGPDATEVDVFAALRRAKDVFRPPASP